MDAVLICQGCSQTF